MRKYVWPICMLGVCAILSGTAFAEDENKLEDENKSEAKNKSDLPWKKGYLELGWFFASTNSEFRFGESNLGIGISLDAEEFLGLDSSTMSFRFDAGWRFSNNKRHKLEFGWLAVHRDSSTRILEEIKIPPALGGGTIGPGDVETTFNYDIIKLKYEYSFLLDDRLDLNIGAGLFVMPMKFGVEAVVGGVGRSKLEEGFTKALPVASLGFDFAITPKWFVRQQLELFYLEIGGFEGNMVRTGVALEYLPWKHVGFGLGFDAMRFEVEANGSFWPGTDFRGNVQFDYIGAQLYLKLFF